MAMPWNERVPMLSINPDAATRDDAAKLASELMEANRRIKEIEAENEQLLKLSENLNEHPEGYNGPCSCKLCKSYG